MENNRYQDSKVYKLICNDGYYYIGTSTQIKLNLIFNRHKYSSKNSTLRVHEHINNIGWDNVKIELIEDYPCDSKQTLIEREQYHINNTNNDAKCLNNTTDVTFNYDTVNDNLNNKYQNGKIYKLICEDGYYYIGSTIQKLYCRLNHHKYASKTGTSTLYKYINSIGCDKVKIELIEKYPCINKQELTIREQYHINNSINDLLCLNNFEETLEEIYEDDNFSDSSNNSINEQDDNLSINSIEDDKYQDGKIYKLSCKDGHYYIGSTVSSLYTRFAAHKYSIKNNTNGGRYSHFSSVPLDDITIELIEDYPCNSRKELREREDYYIKESRSDIYCLNTYRAFQTENDKKEYDKLYYNENKEKVKETIKQYYEANKNTIIESHREYNEKNRDKVDAYHAKYRLDNAEKRREYTRQYALEHPEQIKESKKRYNQENKEKIAEYWRNYRNDEENKEKLRIIKQRSAQKIKEQNAEQIAKEREEKKQKRDEKTKARLEHDNTVVQCTCGGSYQNYRKKRHDESKKHIAFVSNSNPSPI